LSIMLCCSALDAVQNLQFCSHALPSHVFQCWRSKSGQKMRGTLLCDSFDKVPPKSHFPSQFTKSVTATSLLWFIIDYSFVKRFLIVEQFQYQVSGLSHLHWFSLSSRLRPALAVTDSESTCVSPCPSDPPRTRPGRSAFACILIPSVTFDFQGHSNMNFTTWHSSWLRYHLRGLKLGRSEGLISAEFVECLEKHMKMNHAFCYLAARPSSPCIK
jgi:hypothetical protein